MRARAPHPKAQHPLEHHDVFISGMLVWRHFVSVWKRAANRTYCSKTSVLTPSKPPKKAMKALLVLRGVTVPRTHSISDLLTALKAQGFDVPVRVQDAAVLTDYAVATRYPGTSEPVTSEDFEEAVTLAGAVVAWVTEVVGQQGRAAQIEEPE